MAVVAGDPNGSISVSSSASSGSSTPHGSQAWAGVRRVFDGTRVVVLVHHGEGQAAQDPLLPPPCATSTRRGRADLGRIGGRIGRRHPARRRVGPRRRARARRVVVVGYDEVRHGTGPPRPGGAQRGRASHDRGGRARLVLPRPGPWPLRQASLLQAVRVPLGDRYRLRRGGGRNPLERTLLFVVHLHLHLLLELELLSLHIWHTPGDHAGQPALPDELAASLNEVRHHVIRIQRRVVHHRAAQISVRRRNARQRLPHEQRGGQSRLVLVLACMNGEWNSRSFPTRCCGRPLPPQWRARNGPRRRHSRRPRPRAGRPSRPR